MKKILPLVLILLLALTGCNTTPQTASSSSTSPSASATAEPSASVTPRLPASQTEPLEGQPIKPDDLNVTVGSQSATALMRLNWSSTYHNGNMLAADGFPDHFIQQIYPQAPILSGADFTLSAINGEFLDASLYANTRKLDIYTSIDSLKAQLEGKSGEYMVEINYIYEGRYIPSMNSTERACYTYFFRLTI